VTVYVKYTGTGIKEEYIPKLFRLFTRIPDNIPQEVSGSGIGLPNVKKIIENLGGTMWVESKEQIGTIFFLKIPLIPSLNSE
jgi:signal transduction histidine kinase